MLINLYLYLNHTYIYAGYINDWNIVNFQILISIQNAHK